MTAVTGMTCQPPRTRLPPPQLAALPDITAALAAQAAGHDRDGSFPADGISLVHDAGLLTATVAGPYGGPGAGLAADGARSCARWARATRRSRWSRAMTLFTHALQAQRRHVAGGGSTRRLLQESARRPGARSTRCGSSRNSAPRPAAGCRRPWPAGRRARWWLTGRKIFSTGAVGLRWMVVWARTDEDPARVGCFLVRTDSPGISIERDLGPPGPAGQPQRRRDLHGHAGAARRHGRAARAAAPGAALPGRRPSSPDERFVAWNTLGLAALYLGVAAAARDWLVGFLNERTPSALGRPLATLPRFQTAVGEIEAVADRGGRPDRRRWRCGWTRATRRSPAHSGDRQADRRPGPPSTRSSRPSPSSETTP